MNKIYHVVWDDEKECFVVVSELAAGQKKAGSAKLTLAIAGALLVGGMAAPAVSAAGDAIKSGIASIANYYSVNDGGTEAGNYNGDGATGANALAAGVNATASGSAATAVGKGAGASGTSSVAMGDSSKATGLMATGVGSGAKGLADMATALGATTSATGIGGTAVGYGANASGEKALASGFDASASGAGSTALGNGAIATAADGVALGSNSIASTAAGVVGYVPTTATAAQAAAINATKSTLGAVSVGDPASRNFRQITGVAAGTADSDAVNVAQLKGATVDSVVYDSSAHDSVTLGGPTYNSTTKAGGTKITNVANGVAPSDAVNKSQLDGLADTPLTFAGNTGSVQKKLGDSVAIQGKGTSPGTYAGDNLRTEVDANGVLQVQMTDKPVFTSVTTGNTTIDNNGVVIAGGPSMTVNGIDAGGGKITNVAAGTDATDAVNVGQLDTAVGGAKSHYYSVNDGGTQAANYNNDGATGANALAAGVNATASGSAATAAGKGANASGTSSVAVGDSSRAMGLMATGVGSGAKGVADMSTALGATTSATGIGGTAAGYGANAAGEKALASGFDASASSAGSTALGNGAIATTADGVALGSNSVANTKAGIAGYIPPTATAAQTTAINATKSTLGAVSMGDAATNKFRQITGVAAGTADSDAVNVAQLKGATADAVLYDNSTHESVTLGGPTYNSTTKTGGTKITNVANGVAPSDAVNVSQLDDLANTPLTFAGNSGTVQKKLGDTVAIQGKGTSPGTYVGDNLKTEVDADGVLQVQMTDKPVFTSVTTGNTTIDNSGLVITGGPSVTVAGINAGGKKITNVAAGAVTDTSTDAVNGSQLKQVQDAATAGWNVTDANGHTANIGPNGKVAFTGDSNVTVTQTGTDDNGQVEMTLNKNLDLGDTGSVTMGNTVVNNNGLSITGGPSITVNGIDAGSKKIVNVAAGDVTSTSTDAVNGSQLKEVKDAATAGWNVTDANGHTANVGPNGKVTFTGDSNVTVTQTGTDNNGQVEMKLNKNLDLGDTGSVTMGNTVVNNNGLSITGGPSVTVNGIDAGSKKITNVADGEDPTDAVNVSQLTTTVEGAKAHYYSVNDNGTQGGNYNNNGATGMNAMAAGIGARATGASSAALGNNAQASTDNSVALGANSTTGPVKGTAGATIAGDNYTFAGANPTGTVSVGSAGQERTITNVAAGVLSADSTDAVNGSQLYATNQAVDKLDGRVSNVENTVNNIAGDISNISTGQAGMFQTSADQKAPAPTPTGHNSAAGGAGSVASGDNSLAVGNGSKATADNSVAIGNGSVADRANTVSVGTAGNERQIANVAAGTQSTDAVNVSQLKSAQAGAVQYDTNSDGSSNYNSVTLNPSGSSATIHNVQAGTATSDAVNVGQLNGAITDTKNWAKSYTDQQVNQMGKRAYAGTASALATANVPQAYQPNQSTLGVGIGNYRGQSAIAVGMSTISESGRYILKASATGSQQDGFGVGVGAGMAW